MTRILYLNGTVGAGKTSVADRIADLLAERGVPHAVIDVDAVRRSWPAPPDDPFNDALATRNLAALVRSYEFVGAALIVIAGVIESRADRAALEVALGTTAWLARLTVDPAEGARRLRLRHAMRPSDEQWHISRLTELDRILAEADIDDIVVDTTGRDIDAVAAEVLDAFEQV